MKSADVVARALSATKFPCKYFLGSGDRDPKASSPEDYDGSCDCSGFALWALGTARFTSDPSHLRRVGHGNKIAWIDTSAIVWDAEQDVGMFSEMSAPAPGCLWIWGDANGKQGHVGIVTALAKNGGVRKIAHCSKGNDKAKPGWGIQETGPEVFLAKKNAIFVRYSGTSDLW
jgi:hypothetical protein